MWISSPCVTYSWDNIDVSAGANTANCFRRMCSGKKISCSERQMLAKVSGVAHPGELLAIMGASGAGKTTLLNCLTLRNTGKLKIRGQRFVNGTLVDGNALARISGYVQQDDVFLPTLTVKEHLSFHGRLRMDRDLTYQERMDRLRETIAELGLANCVNAVIGNPERGIKGISGGERKRLAFACEILTDPSLMFCDEPTSGLDSYMAQNIVQVLKNMVSKGKTVICTIHQPSSEVFALFDKILLMAEGRTAFLGPASQALSFFSFQGFHCPLNYNPADFYIHTLATVPGQVAESKQRCKAICDFYDSSEFGLQIRQQIKANHPVTSSVKTTTHFMDYHVGPSPYKVGWWAQFGAVMWRSVLSVIRDPFVLRIKMFQICFVTCLIALVYQGQTLDYKSIRNIQGVIFLFITEVTFPTVFGTIDVITAELPIFLREHKNGMYRSDVYFLCKSLADLPIFTFLSLVLVAVAYYVVGLNPEMSRFLTACGILVLVANCSASFGFMISCLSDSTKVALSLAGPFLVPLILFGGFFQQVGTAPAYLDWIRYLSWFMYANEALTINQWRRVTFNDTDSSCPDTICSGDDIIASFSFNPDSFYQDIGLLFALIVAFRLTAFLGLLRKTYTVS